MVFVHAIVIIANNAKLRLTMKAELLVTRSQESALPEVKSESRPSLMSSMQAVIDIILHCPIHQWAY